MEHLSLLAGGQEHTVADWERQAAAVLRKLGRLGADDPESAVWDKLTRNTLDGIGVVPLGTPEQLRGPADQGQPGEPPYTRGAALRPSTGWDVRVFHGDPDPAITKDAILADLE